MWPHVRRGGFTISHNGNSSKVGRERHILGNDFNIELYDDSSRTQYLIEIKCSLHNRDITSQADTKLICMDHVV